MFFFYFLLGIAYLKLGSVGKSESKYLNTCIYTRIVTFVISHIFSAQLIFLLPYFIVSPHKHGHSMTVLNQSTVCPNKHGNSVPILN